MAVEIALLGGFRHPGADGVQIHVGHAGEDRGVVQKGLGFEAPFPETALTVVLAVGPAGNGFVENAHEPGNVGQAGSPFLDDFTGFSVRRLGVVLTAQIALDAQRGAEQRAPALDHLALAPGGGGVRVYPENHVVVVAHQRIGAEVDAEGGGQGFEFVDDPLAVVFVVLAGKVVDAAEEGAAYAAGITVVVRPREEW